ncbi:MAG TPA: DUF881 domain-containing protein [Micromonosporaceae bacterium]|nr:DUF881 domain-containing protein [Micromonosporaceae bacterium]
MSESGEERADTERREPARTYAPDFLTQLFHAPLDPGYLDAAARRQVTGPPQPWQRTGARSLRTLALLVVGFLLAVAYLQTVAEAPDRTKVREALSDQIKRQEAETDKLAQHADLLREEVARQRDAALSIGEAARLRELEAGTGLARVRGDGVVVQVSDAAPDADAVTGTGGTDQGRVLDRDLQHIANDLWSAGAEAISINGQRLTSTSTIRVAGSAILVDFRPIVGPYEVSAIGPDSMVRRFQDSLTAHLLRRLAKEHGMGFQVREVDDLVLPAAGEPQLRYARPSPVPTAERSTSPPPSGGGTSTSPSGGG